MLKKNKETDYTERNGCHNCVYSGTNFVASNPDLICNGRRDKFLVKRWGICGRWSKKNLRITNGELVKLADGELPELVNDNWGDLETVIVPLAKEVLAFRSNNDDLKAKRKKDLLNFWKIQMDALS